VAIPRISVLVSGRGSNLEALLAAQRDQHLGGTITAVISSRGAAPALGIAAAQGVATTVVESRDFAERDAYEAALAVAIDASEPDLVVLAGFMRILGAPLVARYQGRMLNIHPSLLPSYPGLHTHRRALADGVRIHGCTVHFVTASLDCGPIVAQGAIPVLDGDDEASLAARVLAVEHRLLPAAVRAFCEGRLVIAGRRVRVKGELVPDSSLEVPTPATSADVAAADAPHD
jgi:phosphoribosylglycinamide formyltransferase-1